jgi:hypothetical protein
MAGGDGLTAMFTAAGIVLLLAISFLAAWANEKDRAGYDRLTDEEARKTLLLHISRDLQLTIPAVWDHSHAWRRCGSAGLLIMVAIAVIDWVTVICR